jgi:hypothetical protein
MVAADHVHRGYRHVEHPGSNLHHGIEAGERLVAAQSVLGKGLQALTLRDQNGRTLHA